MGLGVCVVFRNDEDAEIFEADRNRRRIDWTEISAQLKFSSPMSRERRRVDRYELHKELFEQFWKTVLELGRPPSQANSTAWRMSQRPQGESKGRSRW